MKACICTLALGLLLGCGGSGNKPKTTFATIGTGSQTGVYYPTGQAIAKMVNDKADTYHIKCTAQSTGGSVFNVNALINGDAEFGIVQSDIQHQAMNGLGPWADKGPQSKLRAVFSIHEELVTLVAAVDTEINSLADLKGKRVNLGNEGSGQRVNSIDALTAIGLDPAKDLTGESVKASEAPGLLQDDRIDAFFFTVGHPSGAIKEATAGRRKVKFVAIDGLDALLARSPYYVRGALPISHYPNAANTEDVPTFGVKATLMTSADVPDDLVYAITREVFENFSAFTTQHPAFASLTKQKMLQGLSAPIHPGAQRYYSEAGLTAAESAP
jgi:TRAP transporter TAXI family solute receptor